MVESEFGVNMDPSCLVTTVQAGGGVMVLGDVFLAHFRPLSANWASFKFPTWALFLTMSIPLWPPCTHPLMVWFLEHDNEFTVLKRPPQSPNLNPIEHLWDVVERELRALDPTNLHQLQGAILSIWANISKECFQHLVESMPRRIKAVLKAKGG